MHAVRIPYRLSPPDLVLTSPACNLSLFCFAQDAAAVFQVLLSIGLLTWVVRVAKNWWEPCLFVLYYFPFLVITLSVKPRTNYAMVLKPSAPESDDSNLSAKLLPECEE